MKPQPQRRNDLHDRRELGVAPSGERLVEALSAQPRIAGDLTHASGACYIA